jgi:hypothetical protein
MPDDQGAIQYTATVTHNTDNLFDTMTATVEIPVRKVTISQKF